MKPLAALLLPPAALPISWALALAAPATGATQCSETLDPPMPSEYAYFGRSVGVSGDLAIVGAPNDNVDGAAYVFDLATGAVQTQFELPLESWGCSAVAIDGNVGVAGASLDSQLTLFHGSAFLFDVTTGQTLFHLHAAPVSAGDFFGEAVAIDGAYVVVGAPVDPLGGWPGAAFVFDASTGQQLHRLTPSDGAPSDGFGTSVDVHDHLAVIGNPHDDDLGFQSGSAYVFDLTTGQEIVKLLPTSGAAYDYFGLGVSIHGNRVVVGAPGNDTVDASAGAAFVFDAATGQLERDLLPLDGAINDRFGHAVSLHGDVAIIGAPHSSGPGRAYLFDAATGEQLAEIFAPDGKPFDGMGSAVARGEVQTVVGIPFDDGPLSNVGSVLHVDLAGFQGSTYCAPANLNSTGGSAVIAAAACPLLWSFLRLEAAGMPPSQFGYFLNSMTKGFVPFPPGSQGNLCLGGSIGRHAQDVQSSGDSGTFSLLVDLSAVPTPSGPVPVQPGETWHFQAWFRDLNPLPTSNFTDAVSVTF